MYNFAKWYISFLQEIIRNIMLFFTTLFSAFGKLFNYSGRGTSFVRFSEAAKGFGVMGWITAVVVFAINVYSSQF